MSSEDLGHKGNFTEGCFPVEVILLRWSSNVIGFLGERNLKSRFHILPVSSL
jgi:hypothetical protein